MGESFPRITGFYEDKNYIESTVIAEQVANIALLVFFI